MAESRSTPDNIGLALIDVSTVTTTTEPEVDHKQADGFRLHIPSTAADLAKVTGQEFVGVAC